MRDERAGVAAGERLRPFCRENAFAYGAVLLAWVAVAAAIAAAADLLVSGSPTLVGWFAVALVAVMGGMAIMFVSSLINLRKLRPGFERLARGERDPEIPPVWCPVLTAATQAARRLTHEVAARREGKER